MIEVFNEGKKERKDFSKESELLGKQIAELRLEGMKKDQTAQSMGKEIASLKLDNMKKDKMSQSLGKQIAEMKIELMQVKGQLKQG